MEAFQSAGFRDVTCAQEERQLSFRTVAELFVHPLIRAIALPDWRALCGFDRESAERLVEVERAFATYVPKGPVTLLTKGASYLLWRGDFSLIRTYMLDHLAWMLSDSTGIPPTYARQSKLIQETYGYYNGAFLEGAQGGRHDQAFIELWRGQKRRKLPFRFGYVDKDKQAHLVVTRPKT